MKMHCTLPALVCLCFVSCSGTDTGNRLQAGAPTILESHEPSVGSWTNRHAKNPDLAGVLVQQFPDSSHEASERKGKHPAMILFVMWDGRVNQVGYRPSGEIIEDFWWDLKQGSHDFSYVWEQLDYSHGSDPTFKSHRDPRA